MLFYPAVISKEGKATLAEFPDCPGCQTFADPGTNIMMEAKEALEGWLETHLLDGEAPPRPRERRSRKLLWVPVDAALAFRIKLRWARLDAHLTQAQLAKRAGVSQQMVAKLEQRRSNPSISTLTKLARAMSVQLELDFAPEKRMRRTA